MRRVLNFFTVFQSQSTRPNIGLALVGVLVAIVGHVVLAARGQVANQGLTTNGITAQGRAQINAVLAEKAALTPDQRKINSRLLHAKRRLTRETSVNVRDIVLPRSPNGRVELELRADVTDALLTAIRALGVDIVATQPSGRSVSVAADLLQIEQLAALREVHSVQPKAAYVTYGPRPAAAPLFAHGDATSPARGREQKLRDRAALIRSVQMAVGEQGFITNVGSVTSQGDVTHKAAIARSTFGAAGAGVKVGVISDGVTNLATSQASGNLGAVTVLPGQSGSGDEGTAMLEIIHDLAPAAQLFFVTADPTPAQFAQNIRDLRNAGCDIIVDDVAYFVESPFQDGQAPSVISPTNGGVIAQAVKDVTAAGALYLSSAGNSGGKDAGSSGTWEGDFLDGGPASIEPGRLHNFGTAAFDVATASTGPISLYWSDPLGASANDYDIFIFDSTGTFLFDFSVDSQLGTQDPFEIMGGAFPGERIVIVKYAGASRFLHLDTSGGRLATSTAGNTHGHADTTSVTSFSVAATPVAAPFAGIGSPGPYPGPFNSTNTVDWFSSDGPRRIFFTSTGSEITPGNVSSSGGQTLQKPDISAADGVAVSGAGGFPSPFFGTSAAAPHAAAIAALVWSAAPLLTALQVRAALLSSAIDIQAAGVDRDSGAGIVMADTAVRAVMTAPRITTSPLSQTVPSHTAAALSVTAESGQPLAYQWHLGPSGTVNPIPGATANTYVTPALDGVAKYWVRVSNGNGSVDSSAATVSVAFTDATHTFTDATLTAGLTLIRAVHVLELRTRIDTLRNTVLLGSFPWSDGTLTVHTTQVQPVHVNELRTALAAVYAARGLPAPTFTGSINSGTPVRALHISELRDAVTAVE